MTTAARVLFDFDDSYARAVPQLSVRWRVRPSPEPRLVALNEELAAELGADPEQLREPAALAMLTGTVPDEVTTTAQAYAGHQFGGYVPRLGDGRALLLGEVRDRDGRRRDIHLKGSGVTPFARGGDGKAPLGPMLREYLMGEAMHALGIPTTRALAVVATGEQVVRETLEPGAVLSRVAASHLRVGTFQYAAASGDFDVVRALADYAIERHYPDAADSAQPYLEFYRRVVAAQAALVARWMSVGFVHGVMNTDNTTISGQTIDYGPCAFMDSYHPKTVFSSIDQTGRYAYGNQPAIAQWNLARLGETLVPLIDENTDAAVEAVTEAVNGYAEQFNRQWSAGLAAKLGLTDPDSDLAGDLLGLLESHGVDWTGFFRALATAVRGDRAAVRALFDDPGQFDTWASRWESKLPADRAAAATAMDRVNPIYIPRNHLVDRALTAATEGDLGPFERLRGVLAHPFDERPGDAEYALPAPPGSAHHVTYCGT
jgi:uncharacterized protein YdiU (UPF0061 family)